MNAVYLKGNQHTLWQIKAANIGGKSSKVSKSSRLWQSDLKCNCSNRDGKKAVSVRAEIK